MNADIRDGQPSAKCRPTHVDHLQSVWQELHPMIAHCVPVLLRTSIESRSIACHEYAMKALII